ncbi:MAG: peroxidase family protein [Haliscomenobacter sp.]|uniref:peroxidase family protein n=1 Tax=Haliscomenobacter sp. TaxID=2717303 RepID=UPI0029B0ED8A|nr:peroxidase family protein [Haliscomenobacter sp.]MDX2067702.1 peroxidase family protein [Haliscomenobacter sp.]
MSHSDSNFSFNVPNSRSFERGKFGRMFPSLPQARFKPELINAIAQKMRRFDDENPTDDLNSIPAGYTYLGQFISHDLTYDPTSISERQIDPEFLWNFRTPALDLDSLYGSHPKVNPVYYASDKGNFLLGKDGKDLFRKPIEDDGDPIMAVIPDPRNDENKIIAQIHLLFQKLHNYFLKKTKKFDEAQKLTKWHYQWIVLHDYLPRILDQETYQEIFEFSAPSNVKRKFYEWRNEPFVPVEFAAAAFRFGHSTVRNTYKVVSRKNIQLQSRGVRRSKPVQSTLPLASLMNRNTSDVEVNINIDLSLFFGPRAQRNHLIEPRISAGLYNIPGLGNLDNEFEYRNSLPFRTIKRGEMVGLPSGEDVAKALNQRVIPVDLQRGDPKFNVPSYEAGYTPTPLWYYILHEAKEYSDIYKKSSNTLGPVGSTIVGEVIIGLLQGDKNSYINQDPNWVSPYWGKDFDMEKLVEGPPDYDNW